MEKTDITIPEWDPKPINLWVITLKEQPDNDIASFTLFADEKEVEVKRRMFNGEEVVDWDSNSTDLAILLDFCVQDLARFSRKYLDRYLKRERPADPVNLYIVRDNFTMTFGIHATTGKLSEHKSYDMEPVQTISQSMMRDM